MPVTPDDRAALRQALLSPRSVALIGQSDDPGKTTGRPLKFLREAGYRGTVYPVNPRRDTVMGERAWKSVSQLPEVPDHAYIVVGTDFVIDAVAECGKAGVKVATILAAGFSETGADGLAREQRLRQVAAETGIRLIGPSSLGVVNLREGVMLTANAAFAEPDIPVGRIFFASHSGTMIGALMSRGKQKGVGFAGLVSIGNEVDLSIGEICLSTLDDPDIDSYLLFLESIRNAAVLREFALGAAARGKPVVGYKLGRSAAAREVAVTHTGALAGEDDVASAFLADCGIARVEKPRGAARGAAAGAPHADPSGRRASAAGCGADDHRRRRHHGGRSARDARRRDRAAERRNLRALRRRRHRGDAGAHRRSHDRRHALRQVQGRARHPHHRARVRHGASRWSAPRRASIPNLPSNRWIDSANAPKPIAAFLVPEATEALLRLEPGRDRELSYTGGLRRCGGGGVRSARGEARGCDASADRRRSRARRARGLRAARPARRATRTNRGARHDHHGGTRPALSVSGRREGPFRRHPAQDRGGRRRPQRARRRGIARRDPSDAGDRAATHRHRARSRAGRADDLGYRRSAGRISRRPRGWSAHHGGGRRRVHRDLSRSLAAPRAGRSRRPHTR